MKIETAIRSVTERTLGSRIYTPSETEVLERLAANDFVSYRRRLLSGCYTLLEVKNLLNIPSDQLTLLIDEGHFLCVKDGRGRIRFPRWQFDASSEDYLVPGLKQVLNAMSGNPLSKILELTTAQPWLAGSSPIETIKAGFHDVVLAHVNDRYELTLTNMQSDSVNPIDG